MKTERELQLELAQLRREVERLTTEIPKVARQWDDIGKQAREATAQMILDRHHVDRAAYFSMAGDAKAAQNVTAATADLRAVGLDPAQIFRQMIDDQTPRITFVEAE